MRYFIIILVALFSLSNFSISAQGPNPRERQTWMRELQQYKNNYLTKEMELTDKQKEKFLPLYNRMDQEVRKLYDDARKMDDSVKAKGNKATNLEYEKAAEAAFEIKGKENKIELKYYQQFKTILTPKQLFKLKVAERDFSRKLMEHHRLHRNKAGKGNRQQKKQKS